MEPVISGASRSDFGLIFFFDKFTIDAAVLSVKESYLLLLLTADRDFAVEHRSVDINTNHKDLKSLQKLIQRMFTGEREQKETP